MNTQKKYESFWLFHLFSLTLHRKNKKNMYTCRNTPLEVLIIRRLRTRHIAKNMSQHAANMSQHMQHTYNNNPLGIAFEKLSNMTCFRGSYDSKNAFFEA